MVLSCMAVPFPYVNYRKSIRESMPEGGFLGTSKIGGSLTTPIWSIGKLQVIQFVNVIDGILHILAEGYFSQLL